MKSTGEVMGVADDFPAAYAKSQLAIDYSLPVEGAAFVSVCDRDKRNIVPVAKHLHLLGFSIMSTRGTARALRASGIPVTEVLKKHEGRPNVLDEIANGRVQLVINTPFGRETRSDGYHIRAAAIKHGITNITTLPAAVAIVQAIEAAKDDRLGVYALQDFEERPPAGSAGA
jgi:carbamoyl-phosphate synthase large subunit